MPLVFNHLPHSVRWDQFEGRDSFTISDLTEVMSVDSGLGLLYCWMQREGRSGSLKRQFDFHYARSMQYSVVEPHLVLAGLDFSSQFPCSGMIALGDEGYIIAPSVKFTLAKGSEIVLMVISPSNSPRAESVEKTSLSFPGLEESVALSTVDGAVRCLGTISGNVKSAKIILNRNPGLPVYKAGFDQEIGEFKPPCQVDVTWKPVGRNFERRLLVFDPFRNQGRMIDDLMDSFWSKEQDDLPDFGDYVIGDGPAVDYSIRFVMDRGLGRHVSDQSRIILT